MTPIPTRKTVLQALALAATLAAGLAGCDTKQIGAPVLTGVQWTRITNSTDVPNPYYPSWRGDSITFEYIRSNGQIRLATMAPDGASLIYIQGGASNTSDQAPRWVNDTTIVFTSSRTAPPEVLLRNADAYNDIWYYTTTTQQLLNLSPTTLEEWDPAPQPGQPGLAYTEGSDPLTGRVTLIPNPLSDPSIRFYLTPSSMSAGEVDWDPTGQTICFSADSAHVARHLFVLSLADTIPHQITTGPFTDYTPRFSPDGTRIAFTSNRTGRSGLWTVSPQEGPASIKLVVFEDAGKNMFTPAWSPDGTRIVVSSDGHNYNRALWVLSNLP